MDVEEEPPDPREAATQGYNLLCNMKGVVSRLFQGASYQEKLNGLEQVEATLTHEEQILCQVEKTSHDGRVSDCIKDVRSEKSIVGTLKGSVLYDLGFA